MTYSTFQPSGDPDPEPPDRVVVPTFYRLSQVRDVLGLGAPSVQTLRREVARGNLRAKRIGRCPRVTDVELRRWALDTGDE